MEYNINILNQIFEFELQENKFKNPSFNFQNILSFLQNMKSNKNEIKKILTKLKHIFIEYKEIAQVIVCSPFFQLKNKGLIEVLIDIFINNNDLRDDSRE